MRGCHLIKHWSSTQTTVALSSAEAELTGICRGATQGLGLQSLSVVLGMPFALNMHTDSIAAIGIIFCDDRDGLAGWCVLQVGI